MKTRLFCTYFRYELLFVFSLLTAFFQVNYVQAAQNAVTFENKSDEPGLVKLIGPTRQIVEVPDMQPRSVNVSDTYDTDPKTAAFSLVNRMIGKATGKSSKNLRIATP